jgi:hypothetical protein
MILIALLAWMIASFLRLPPNPELVSEPTPSQVDLEDQFAREFGPVDDRSYQKAMWWRNLNRIMSAVGTLLLGVIVRSTPTQFIVHPLTILPDRIGHSCSKNVIALIQPTAYHTNTIISIFPTFMTFYPFIY